MKVQWNEQLRCPRCRKIGTTNLMQRGCHDVPTVNDITEGFRVAYTPYGPSFRCEACDVEGDLSPLSWLVRSVGGLP